MLLTLPLETRAIALGAGPWGSTCVTQEAEGGDGKTALYWDFCGKQGRAGKQFRTG